jgi:hypothetical protein
MEKDQRSLLLRSSYLQRYQLELHLETTPREVYSNKLIDAMRKEELLTRDGKAVPSNTIKAIDEMLKSETERFYRKITNDNIRKWNSLRQKLDMDMKNIPEQGKSEGLKAEKGAEATSNPFEAELMRLEEDYNKNWIHYEGRNMKCAFMSQMGRVEQDWNTHEANLTDDFNRRKISEKIGHNRMKEGAAQKQYAMSMESLQRQKEASKRWMSRQELRLMSQAKEMHRERELISTVLQDQINFSRQT